MSGWMTVSLLYTRNSNIETLCKAKIQIWVSPKQVVPLQLSTPHIQIVRGEQVSSSLSEDSTGCHALIPHILSRYVWTGVKHLDIPPWFGN